MGRFAVSMVGGERAVAARSLHGSDASLVAGRHAVATRSLHSSDASLVAGRHAVATGSLHSSNTSPATTAMASMISRRLIAGRRYYSVSMVSAALVVAVAGASTVVAWRTGRTS